MSCTVSVCVHNHNCIINDPILVHDSNINRYEYCCSDGELRTRSRIHATATCSTATVRQIIQSINKKTSICTLTVRRQLCLHKCAYCMCVVVHCSIPQRPETVILCIKLSFYFYLSYLAHHRRHSTAAINTEIQMHRRDIA